MGMLYEISASPSPGLVSPASCGAHDDMDYFTFLRSTSAIAYAMYLCAQIGLDEDGDILTKLRAVGIEAETRMLAVTGHINTQKGLLFLAGMICGAAGQCLKHGQPVNRHNVALRCSLIGADLIDKELKTVHEKAADQAGISHGERQYLRYGVTGIRGEVARGFPSVINTGLPLYEEALAAGLSVPEALVQSLMGLMKVAEDTTVLHRCGMNGLKRLQKRAARFFTLGGMKTQAGKRYLRSLDAFFTKHRMSPGGAADLLAATVMIYQLEKDFS